MEKRLTVVFAFIFLLASCIITTKASSSDVSSVPTPTQAASAPTTTQTLWSVQTVDYAFSPQPIYYFGVQLSPCPIVIDNNNVPHILYTKHIVYYDLYGKEQSYTVNYASLNGLAWSSWIVNSAGVADSFALSNYGIPNIVCTSEGGEGAGSLFDVGAGHNQTIGTRGTANAQVAIDSFGKPHIAYSSNGDAVYYASWNGSSWVVQTVATYPPETILWGGGELGDFLYR